MSQESIRKSRFRRQSVAGEDACQFCDYYEYDRKRDMEVCHLHQIKFYKDFVSGENVCDSFEGSHFDAIVDAHKKYL